MPPLLKRWRVVKLRNGMNIYKTFGIVLLLTVLNVWGTANANAGFFDWVKNSAEAETAEDAAWSFDTVYQNVRGLSLESVSAPALQANAVASVNSPAASKAKPIRQPAKKAKTFVISASAYSSTPDQTDDTPFITARGTYVRDGIVAANFLPFGTAIKIPELYGDKIFIVEDRMNKRYWHNVDIWFSTREAAKQFGRKSVTIEIVS